MTTMYLATCNKIAEIFDTREEAEAFALQMNDDSYPFKASIREIDTQEAFDLLHKEGTASYFGEKWDGNRPTIDWDEYRARVEELESEGMTTSDAQSIADMEWERGEA